MKRARGGTGREGGGKEEGGRGGRCCLRFEKQEGEKEGRVREEGLAVVTSRGGCFVLGELGKFFIRGDRRRVGSR